MANELKNFFEKILRISELVYNFVDNPNADVYGVRT